MLLSLDKTQMPWISENYILKDKNKNKSAYSEVRLHKGRVMISDLSPWSCAFARYALLFKLVLWVGNEYNCLVLVIRFYSSDIVSLVKFFHCWWWMIYLSENMLIFWKVLFRKCSCTITESSMYICIFSCNIITYKLQLILLTYLKEPYKTMKRFKRDLSENSGRKLKQRSNYFFKKVCFTWNLSACSLRTTDTSSKCLLTSYLRPCSIKLMRSVGQMVHSQEIKSNFHC